VNNTTEGTTSAVYQALLWHSGKSPRCVPVCSEVGLMSVSFLVSCSVSNSLTGSNKTDLEGTRYDGVDWIHLVL
jgi:hypothetical protein